MISRIIKVSVRVINLSLRLRLITPTSTFIIMDITKTSSNNCLIILLVSLRAGSHLRAHAGVAKSEFKSEAILQGVRESEPALISVIFSLPPPNRRNEIIQLNFTANIKFESKVDSSLTAQFQISRESKILASSTLQ